MMCHCLTYQRKKCTGKSKTRGKQDCVYYYSDDRDIIYRFMEAITIDVRVGFFYVYAILSRNSQIGRSKIRIEKEEGSCRARSRSITPTTRCYLLPFSFQTRIRIFACELIQPVTSYLASIGRLRSLAYPSVRDRASSDTRRQINDTPSVQPNHHADWHRSNRQVAAVPRVNDLDSTVFHRVALHTKYFALNPIYLGNRSSRPCYLQNDRCRSRSNRGTTREREDASRG